MKILIKKGSFKFSYESNNEFKSMEGITKEVKLVTSEAVETFKNLRHEN